MTREQEFLLELELDDRHHRQKGSEGYYTSDLIRLYNERLVEMVEREIDLRIQGEQNMSKMFQKHSARLKALKEKYVNAGVKP